MPSLATNTEREVKPDTAFRSLPSLNNGKSRSMRILHTISNLTDGRRAVSVAQLTRNSRHTEHGVDV